MASSSQAPQTPSPQAQPQQAQPQQAPAPQEAQPELAPLDDSSYDSSDLDSGLEATIRALKRGEALPGQPGDETDRPSGRDAAEAPDDASGEAAGEDGPTGDTRRTEPPVPKASQWASLNRREQEFARKQQEFAKQRQELEAQASALKKGRTNTWEALKALGFENRDEFLEHLAQTGGTASPEQQEIAELKAWKVAQEKELADTRQRAKEEAQANEYRQQVATWHTNIGQYVKSSDRWKDSLVGLDGNEAKVFQVIQDHYQQTGEQIDHDDAIAQVNTGLEQQLTQALRAIASTPRGRAIAEDIVGKLTPQKSGKSVPQPKGLSSTVRQLSSTDSKSDLTLDEALEQNAAWLRSQRGGRR